MKLVLFDIDGTLIWTDGAGRSAIQAALLAEMGTTGPIDSFRFDGRTDREIVRALMVAAGHPNGESADHIDAVCRRYVELLAIELHHPDRKMHVYPGVNELLDALTARTDAIVGLLTGNLARGAELKLRRAGIDFGRFRMGAFGSDSAERSELPAIAAGRAADLMGSEPSGEDIVIIGDTPSDVRCGQPVGARAIAVATGSYSVDELREVGPHAVFQDLSDTESVLASIFA